MWRYLSLYLPLRRCLLCPGRSTRELYNFHSLASAVVAHLTKDCVNTSKHHRFPSPNGHPTALLTNPVEQQGQEISPPIIQQTKLWQDLDDLHTATPVIPKTNRATTYFRETLRKLTQKAKLEVDIAVQLISLVERINLLASKTQGMAVSTSDPDGFNWANGHSRSLEGWEGYVLPNAYRCETLSSPTPTITWRS